jgi:hypothetical protein
LNISRSATPTRTSGGAMLPRDTLNPSWDTIQPVLVVPTLAPKITPMDCLKVSRPALTKPTVVTVVAVDDCTSAVTSAPQPTPDHGPPT